MRLIYSLVILLATVVPGVSLSQGIALPELEDRSAQSLSGLNNDVYTKSIEIGDFNADGLEDLVVARWDVAPVLLINEAGVLNNTTTDFIENPNLAANSNYVEAFDANGDGWTDLVFARLDRAPWLLLNRGNSASGEWLGFDGGVALEGANNILLIESGDVTGDGAEDLFVVEVEFGTNKLLVNNGEGLFTEQSEKLGELGLLQRGHSALLDDADNDGDVDIVYIESDLFLFVYYNDGAGNFSNQQRFSFQNTDGFAYIFGAADFNGDGRFDFRNYSNTAPMAVMSSSITDSQGLPVYLIRQDASMARGNRKHGTAHMRDVDGDGDMDYVLSSMLRNFGGLENTFEGMRTEIVINAGDNSGTFIPFAGEDWSRDESMDAKILDVNGDGSMDLFVAHQRRYGVYLNNASQKVVELGSIAALPTAVGNAVGVTVELQSGENVSYEWDFGDGTLLTTQQPTANHVYQEPGRYVISVVARSVDGSDQVTMTHRVHLPLIDGESMSSSSLIVVDGSVWVVNPDHNSVSVINPITGVVTAEIAVQEKPRNLALVGGNVWVTNKRSASVSVISAQSFAVVDEIQLRPGSLPHGIVGFGLFAYVVLEGSGEVVKINQLTRTVVGAALVGKNPRHLAVTGNGRRLYVPQFITSPVSGESTRRVSTDAGAKVVVVSTDQMSIDSVIQLPYNDVEDNDRGARGVPNYLMAPVISPDGSYAYIPAKLDNIYRGSLRDGNAREHNQLVRSMLATVNLEVGAERIESRIDFDNNSPPTAVAVGPTGNFLFIIHEASRLLEVLDVYSSEIIFSTDVGFAPQGIAFFNDLLFVDNTLSRSLSVFDVSGLMSGASDNAVLQRTINTVSQEMLDQEVLIGKRLFHDAQDAALTGQKYISCAVCHSEGGHDGRTWDFSDAGEGLRNTIDLRGRSGMGHGNVHWTANFDEIHDFENDIREIFDGTGLLTDEDYNRTAGILDANNPKAGLSSRLDALAAYVTTFDTFDDSPHRGSDGQRTASADRGREVFRKANCARCHSGAEFTDSPQGRFHNIGTVDTDTGSRLGRALVGNGLDTPTLRGVWQTAPYLHDGSAPDLQTAVRAHRSVQVGYNVARLSQAEMNDLEQYLLQLDGREPQATSLLDHDGDGIPNTIDPDDDNDTVPDAEDAFPTDATETRDQDTDGIGDNQDTDDDNDGIPDLIENQAPNDVDGDGIANRIDLDSDGDALPDIIEAGGTDADRNAIVDAPEWQGGLVVLPDTDNDNLPDVYDIESNNALNNGAGPFDIITSTWNSLDTNNDGVLSQADRGFSDNNNDGIDDRVVLSGDFRVGGGGGAISLSILFGYWYVIGALLLRRRVGASALQ